MLDGVIRPKGSVCALLRLKEQLVREVSIHLYVLKMFLLMRYITGSEMSWYGYSLQWSWAVLDYGTTSPRSPVEWRSVIGVLWEYPQFTEGSYSSLNQIIVYESVCL